MLHTLPILLLVVLLAYLVLRLRQYLHELYNIVHGLEKRIDKLEKMSIKYKVLIDTNTINIDKILNNDEVSTD